MCTTGTCSLFESEESNTKAKPKAEPVEERSCEEVKLEERCPFMNNSIICFVFQSDLNNEEEKKENSSEKVKNNHFF